MIDDKYLDLMKKFDGVLSRIPTNIIITTSFYELDPARLVDLMNESLTEEEEPFKYEDFVKGGRLYAIFLYMIIRLHASLWTENCTWWKHFMSNMDDIFEKYNEVCIPDGVGIYFDNEFDLSRVKARHQTWLMTQIGYWKNGHSNWQRFETVAKKGSYLYQLLETVGVCFDPKKIASDIKTRADQRNKKRIDEINNRNADTNSERPAAAVNKWKRAKKP